MFCPLTIRKGTRIHFSFWHLFSKLIICFSRFIFLEIKGSQTSKCHFSLSFLVFSLCCWCDIVLLCQDLGEIHRNFISIGSQIITLSFGKFVFDNQSCARVSVLTKVSPSSPLAPPVEALRLFRTLCLSNDRSFPFRPQETKRKPKIITIITKK